MSTTAAALPAVRSRSRPVADPWKASQSLQATPSKGSLSRLGDRRLGVHSKSYASSPLPPLPTSAMGNVLMASNGRDSPMRDLAEDDDQHLLRSSRKRSTRPSSRSIKSSRSSRSSKSEGRSSSSRHASSRRSRSTRNIGDDLNSNNEDDIAATHGLDPLEDENNNENDNIFNEKHDTDQDQDRHRSGRKRSSRNRESSLSRALINNSSERDIVDDSELNQEEFFSPRHRRTHRSSRSKSSSSRHLSSKGASSRTHHSSSSLSVAHNINDDEDEIMGSEDFAITGKESTKRSSRSKRRRYDEHPVDEDNVHGDEIDDLLNDDDLEVGHSRRGRKNVDESTMIDVGSNGSKRGSINISNSTKTASSDAYSNGGRRSGYESRAHKRRDYDRKEGSSDERDSILAAGSNRASRRENLSSMNLLDEHISGSSSSSNGYLAGRQIRSGSYVSGGSKRIYDDIDAKLNYRRPSSSVIPRSMSSVGPSSTPLSLPPLSVTGNGLIDMDNQVLRQELDEMKFAYDELRRSHERLEIQATTEAAEKFAEYKRATEKRMAAYEEYNATVKESLVRMKQSTRDKVVELRSTEGQIEDLEKANERLIGTIDDMKAHESELMDQVQQLTQSFQEHDSHIKIRDERITELETGLEQVQEAFEEEKADLVNVFEREKEMLIEQLNLVQSKLERTLEQHAQEELKSMRKNIESGETESGTSGQNHHQAQYQRTLNKMIRFYEALTGMSIESIQREVQVDQSTGKQNKVLVFRCSHQTKSSGVFEYKLGVGEDGVYTYQPLEEDHDASGMQTPGDGEPAVKTQSVLEKVLSKFMQRENAEGEAQTEIRAGGPVWLRESVEFEDAGKFFWRMLDYLQDA